MCPFLGFGVRVFARCCCLGLRYFNLENASLTYIIGVDKYVYHAIAIAKGS